MSISNEIREYASEYDRSYVFNYGEMRAFAARLDREMVELPKDRDGAPIHVGDTVYLKDGRKGEVSRIILGREETSIDIWMCDEGRFFYSVAQGDMTHTVPDSLESIAEKLYEMATEEGQQRLASLAEWLYSLAEKGGER